MNGDTRLPDYAGDGVRHASDLSGVSSVGLKGGFQKSQI